IAGSYTALAGHSAFLPASYTGGYTNRGNEAMTDYPMYNNCNYQWAVDGNGSCGNDRWEVDDATATLGSCGCTAVGSYDSHHQIWVR
ncbi:MAG: hypothetical protein KF690_12395, partial [Bacteroidetes bacterium]|nr:hypothetical protein [Bacteroidota bacterium]